MTRLFYNNAICGLRVLRSYENSSVYVLFIACLFIIFPTIRFTGYLLFVL